MRPPEVDEQEPAAELLARPLRERQPLDAGFRVPGHMDEQNAAVGRADLVLDPALLSELLGLDPVGQGHEPVAVEPGSREDIQGAEQGDADRGRRARRDRGRDRREDIDLEPQILGERESADRVPEERVGAGGGLPGLDEKRFAVVFRVHRDPPRGPVLVGIGPDLDFDGGRDGQVLDETFAREPGIGPAADVAQAEGGPGVNQAERRGHGAPYSRRWRTMSRLTAATMMPPMMISWM